MSHLNIQQAARVAGQFLGVTEEEALRHSQEVPEIDAYFYWQPVRGGGQILVGSDGSAMFGISAYTLDDMIGHFKDGARTDPATRRAMRVEK